MRIINEASNWEMTMITKTISIRLFSFYIKRSSPLSFCVLIVAEYVIVLSEHKFVACIYSCALRERWIMLQDCMEQVSKNRGHCVKQCTKNEVVLGRSTEQTNYMIVASTREMSFGFENEWFGNCSGKG